MKFDPHHIQAILAMFDRRAVTALDLRMRDEQQLPPTITPNPLDSPQVRKEFKARIDALIDNGSLLEKRCLNHGWGISNQLHITIMELMEKHAPLPPKADSAYFGRKYEFVNPANIAFTASLLDFRNKLETALLFDSGREAIEKIFIDAKI